VRVNLAELRSWIEAYPKKGSLDELLVLACDEIEHLRREVADAHEIIRADVATHEALLMRTLLEEYLCASSEFDMDGWLRRVRAVTEDAAEDEPALVVGCHRSHPHENMDAECQRLTEIARAQSRDAQ